MDWKQRLEEFEKLCKEFESIQAPANCRFRFSDDPPRVDIYSDEKQCFIGSVCSVAEYARWLEEEKRLDLLLQQRIASWHFLSV